jgi:exopolyphosphatase/guanosine-5'-triphosphate,3'-diphosphate pyrophosphatase
MRVGVLDLGSNSFHLLVAERDADGELVKIDAAKEMVRLGAGTLRTGRIDEAARLRALDALGRLAARARAAGARLVAVATSAVREAENRDELIAAARRVHGVEIEVLSGVEEARLIYLGARGALVGRVAVVDIGGGSIELAVGDDARCVVARSLPLGVLRLREALVPSDGYVSERTAELVRAAVREGATGAATEVRALAPRVVVLTSGTARTVLALANDLGPAHGVSQELRRAAVRRLIAIFSKLRPAELPSLGVEEGRSDTIAVGAVVIDTLLDLLDVGTAVVSDRALREGVALAVTPPPRRAAAAVDSLALRD